MYVEFKVNPGLRYDSYYLQRRLKYFRQCMKQRKQNELRANFLNIS